MILLLLLPPLIVWAIFLRPRQDPPLVSPGEGKKRDPGNRIGCALGVLWVVGGTVTVVLSALNGFGAEWQCADSGRYCDDHSAETGLLIGFGIITLITVAVVVAYRRGRREADVERIDRRH